MKLSSPDSKIGEPQPRSTLDAPPRPELRWIRCCLILLLASGALQFAGSEEIARHDSTPSLIAFGLALVAGSVAILIGLRHLLVRPGAFLVLLGFGSIALVGAVGFLRSEAPADVLESLAFPLLFTLALATTHVAAGAGMRASELARLLGIAVVLGLLWQAGLGLLANRSGVPVASPTFSTAGLGIGFLIAWAFCRLLLRSTRSRLTIVATAGAIAGGALLISIPHGMAIPLLVLPSTGVAIALGLGSRWRFFSGGSLWQKFAPVAALLALGSAQCFTDKATATLQLPALGTSTEMLTLGAVLLVMLATAALSLRSAWRNSETVMGRWAGDAPLMFLPFVGGFTILGGIATGAPFSEPLAAILLGALAAMPQCFFNRAYYLRHRENEAAISPQLILSEEDLPTTWQDAFPSNA